MTVLSGGMIRLHSIITPFVPRTEVIFQDRKYSYGCGFAGYDVRVEFDKEGKEENLRIYPSEFKLASTIEHFTMPSDIIGVVHDKSSWARRGLLVQNTVIEPGWKGHLTLELTNNYHMPILLKRGLPIAQIVFHRIEFTNIELSSGVASSGGYDGKYQDQERGPQEAR